MSSGEGGNQKSSGERRQSDVIREEDVRTPGVDVGLWLRVEYEGRDHVAPARVNSQAAYLMRDAIRCHQRSSSEVIIRGHHQRSSAREVSEAAHVVLVRV
jgi:hypothetical protein